MPATLRGPTGVRSVPSPARLTAALLWCLSACAVVQRTPQAAAVAFPACEARALRVESLRCEAGGPCRAVLTGCGRREAFTWNPAPGAPASAEARAAFTLAEADDPAAWWPGAKLAPLDVLRWQTLSSQAPPVVLE